MTVSKKIKLARCMAGLAVLIVGLGGAAALHAATGDATSPVPRSLTQQGRILDSTGSPVTGTVAVVFTLYGDATASASKLWTETQNLTLDDGYFSTQLGAAAANAFPTGAFDGSVRFLGITVGSDPEMSPRQAITSVPYALFAGAADSAAHAATADSAAHAATADTATSATHASTADSATSAGHASAADSASSAAGTLVSQLNGKLDTSTIGGPSFTPGSAPPAGTVFTIQAQSNVGLSDSLGRLYIPYTSPFPHVLGRERLRHSVVLPSDGIQELLSSVFAHGSKLLCFFGVTLGQGFRCGEICDRSRGAFGNVDD